jgi:hypothetical protein
VNQWARVAVIRRSVLVAIERGATDEAWIVLCAGGFVDAQVLVVENAVAVTVGNRRRGSSRRRVRTSSGLRVGA